jgi:hypothetical protein
VPHLSLHSQISRPAADPLPIIWLMEERDSWQVFARLSGLLNTRLPMYAKTLCVGAEQRGKTVGTLICVHRHHNLDCSLGLPKTGRAWDVDQLLWLPLGLWTGCSRNLQALKCSQATAARQPSSDLPERRRFEVLGVLRQTITLKFPAKTIYGELATPTSGASLLQLNSTSPVSPYFTISANDWPQSP